MMGPTMSDTSRRESTDVESKGSSAPTEAWRSVVSEVSADFAAAANAGKEPRIADFLARIGKLNAQAKETDPPSSSPLGLPGLPGQAAW